MPTYEYACKSCGNMFEIVQSMTDEPLVTCPECGGELRKVFAPPAIAFKGSGFYATDHGKKSKKPAERTADKGASTAGDGSGTSAGSKDGPKPSTKPSDKPSASGPSSASSAGSSS